MTLPVSGGGTGQTSFPFGAILLGDNASPVAILNPGNPGYVVQDNGTIFTTVGPMEQRVVLTITGATAIIATATTPVVLVGASSNTVIIPTRLWTHLTGTAFTTGESFVLALGQPPVAQVGPSISATNFTVTDRMGYSQSSSISSGQTFSGDNAQALVCGFGSAPVGGDATTTLKIVVYYLTFSS